MLALVYGPDASLARAEVAALVRRHDPEGRNTSVLDGRTVSPGQVITNVATAGFFGEPRVVVVHDLMARSSRTAATGEGSDDGIGAGGVDLKALFESVPPINLLVLVDAELGSVPAAVRKAAPTDTLVVGGEPPRGPRLVEWIRTRVAEADSGIDAATARYLAERLYPQTWSAKPTNPRFDRPPNLELLANEVEKLALAAYPDHILHRHAEAMVAAGDDDRVFRFVEAAATGRLETALSELQRLLDAGEEPAKLAAQIQQQIELAAVLEAAGPRADPGAVGRAIGLATPGRMAAIASSLRGLAAGISAASVAAGRTVDRRTKHGELRQPEDGLYDLVIALASRPPRRMSDTRRSGGT